MAPRFRPRLLAGDAGCHRRHGGCGHRRAGEDRRRRLGCPPARPAGEYGQRAGSAPSLVLIEEPDCQPGRQRLQASGCCASSEWIRRAIALGRATSKWNQHGSDHFDGEIEACINGRAVSVGAYFGEDVRGIVGRLPTEQLEDGGGNCGAGRGSTPGRMRH